MLPEICPYTYSSGTCECYLFWKNGFLQTYQLNDIKVGDSSGLFLQALNATASVPMRDSQKEIRYTEKRRQYWQRRTHTLSLPTPLASQTHRAPGGSAITQQTIRSPLHRSIFQSKLHRSSPSHHQRTIQSSQTSLGDSHCKPVLSLDSLEPLTLSQILTGHTARTWEWKAAETMPVLSTTRLFLRASRETIIPKTLLGATDLLSLIPFYLMSRAT